MGQHVLEDSQDGSNVIQVVAVAINHHCVAFQFEKVPFVAGRDTSKEGCEVVAFTLVKQAGSDHLPGALPQTTLNRVKSL